MYEVLLSLIPAVVLLAVILWIDRKNPEPFGEIALALLGGVCAVVICLPLGIQAQMYQVQINDGLGIISSLNESLFGAALPEELAKLLVLFLLVRRNRHFNEHVDGIVYAALIGLGFAAYENVLYVVGSEDVEQTAAIRAILSVPGHFMFALFMGYWFSKRWWEDSHKFRNMAFALLIPMICHTAFDFTCFFIGQFEDGSGVLEIVTMIILLGINITGFIKARKFIGKQLMEDASLIQQEILPLPQEEEPPTDMLSETTEETTGETSEEPAETSTEKILEETTEEEDSEEPVHHQEKDESKDSVTEESEREEETTQNLACFDVAKANVIKRIAQRKGERFENVHEEQKKAPSRANVVWSRIYVIIMIVVACIAILILGLTVATTKQEKKDRNEQAKTERIQTEEDIQEMSQNIENNQDEIRALAEDGDVASMCTMACICWSYETELDSLNAQEWIDKALEITDEERVANYLNDAAYAYSYNGQKEFSVRILDYAIELCPTKSTSLKANLYDSRGEMYWELGDKKEAKKMWKKAIDTYPNFLEEYGETTLYNYLKDNGEI